MFEAVIGQAWRGKCIGFGEARTGEDHAFWPGEAPAIARAIPARQAEFAAGRAAARRALGSMGMLPYAIPMGGDRAPVWPKGLVGSITHHEDRAFAVTARRGTLAGLGIDVEPMEPLPQDLWPEILTGPEVRWLTSQQADLQGALARMIFSAKEASYKALFPHTGEIVGFDAMRIDPDPARGRFTATLLKRFGAYPAQLRLDGQLACRDGLILTLLALPLGAECGETVAGTAQMEMECFQISGP